MPLRKKLEDDESSTSINNAPLKRSCDYARPFLKDIQSLERSGKFDKKKLLDVIDFLVRGKSLPRQCRDHPLRGDLYGTRECHLKDDLLLLYMIEKDKLVLLRIGTHTQLFG